MHIDDQYGAAITTVWSAMRELALPTRSVSFPSTRLSALTSRGAVPAALQLEVLKKLRLVQLISRGAVLPLPKYAHSSLSRILKNPDAEWLHTLPDKDQLAKNADIDRAPRWTLKKPMATYVTLGLSDIARIVGIRSEDEVRALGLSMIETGDISAQISASSTVTFPYRPPQISKDEVDTGLYHNDTAARTGPSTRAIASSSSQSDRADCDGPPARPRTRKRDKRGPHGQRDLTKALSASAAASAMHFIVAAGIQAQLLSNWTASPSIGQMELIFNGSSSISQASAHRAAGVTCAVASVPRHECCQVPHTVPPPPDPRAAAADAGGGADGSAGAGQAQAAADRSARDERGRPRVIAHLSM
ncbi:hypothetical protein B0H14DRAFT_3861173 [Mycena olivaceomarginata]|nr:hypothetical protein B0H14DRAFT_3861173 [Mycena olivaceomarginata]